MEHLESRALDTAPTHSTLWYQYADDTMAKIHECAVDSFSVTSEQEKYGRIPFLDTCVHLNQDGSTKVFVYRKPTHTDQYLNFHSNHHDVASSDLGYQRWWQNKGNSARVTSFESKLSTLDANSIALQVWNIRNRRAPKLEENLRIRATHQRNFWTPSKSF